MHNRFKYLPSAVYNFIYLMYDALTGGMTLTLAMVGIGVGGYKFYKMRYDINYRTL